MRGILGGVLLVGPLLAQSPNFQGLGGTYRVLSALDFGAPALVFVVPDLNLSWRDYAVDSVPYVSDSTYQRVTRMMNTLWLAGGVWFPHGELTVSSPIKIDMWNGDFDPEYNVIWSWGFGDLFFNLKGDYTLAAGGGYLGLGLRFGYSIPLSGDWDSVPGDLTTRTLPYSGGLWRLLSYRSTSTRWTAITSWSPLEILALHLNLDLSSGANGDPDDNTFGLGTAVELRLGAYSPYLEWWWSTFLGDGPNLHGPGPGGLNIGIRTVSGSGLLLAAWMNFLEPDRSKAQDNLRRPDFWLPSWTPTWNFGAGVRYIYSGRKTLGPTGVLAGSVLKAGTGQGVLALITVPGTQYNRVPTNQDGSFRLEGLPVGTLTVIVEAPDYKMLTERVVVKRAKTTVKQFYLEPTAGAVAGAQTQGGVLAGKVADKLTGKPVKAKITFLDLDVPPVETDEYGIFKVQNVPEGLYTLRIEAPGYSPSVEVVGVEAGGASVKEFYLSPAGTPPAQVGAEKERATAEAFLSMARSKLEAGALDEAERYIDIAMVWAPDDPQIKAKAQRLEADLRKARAQRHEARGAELYNQGNYLEALREFNEALRLDPGSEVARRFADASFNALLESQASAKAEVQDLVQRASYLYAQGQYDSAMALWQKALELDPNNQAVAEMMKEAKARRAERVAQLVSEAQKALAAGKLSRAESLAKRALSMDPGNQEAQGILSQAKAKRRERAQAKLSQGISLYNQGKYQAAAEALRLALRYDPQNQEAKRYLSMAQEKLRAERAKPAGDPEELYLKGVEAYVRGDYETAIYYWERVLAIDPNHAKAKRNLARAKARLNQ